MPQRLRIRQFAVVCLLLGALLVSWGLPASGGTLHGKSASSETEQRPWLMVGMGPNGGCSAGCRRAFHVVVSMTGRKGVILPFAEASAEKIAAMAPEFIILGPQGTPWCRYTGSKGVELQNFLWILPYVVEELNIPVLGICGGHQALALAFGGKVGPIRGGTDDCLPYQRVRQSGVVSIGLRSPDPIFRGLDQELRIVQSHYDEVKSMPPGFVLLASERLSLVQIMRHPTRPAYGIQGHPENFHTGRPDGGILIRNFIDIATTYNRVYRDTRSYSLGEFPISRGSAQALSGQALLNAPSVERKPRTLYK
ncbi:MAG: gamma-glutamyl-gamma-aminobutyrate hydrolase family protein [Thermodesulfobacteriota bacterium]